MIDAAVSILRIVGKVVFFSVPAIIVLMLIALGSGNLDYAEVKEGAVSAYNTAVTIVQTINPETIFEGITEYAKDRVESFGDIFKSGLQLAYEYVVDLGTTISHIWEAWWS